MQKVILILAVVILATAISSAGQELVTSYVPFDNSSLDDSLVPIDELIQDSAVASNDTDLNDSCANKFECTERDGQYRYDCFFDIELDDCRCFLGDFLQCDRDKSGLDFSDFAEEETQVPGVLGNVIVEIRGGANSAYYTVTNARPFVQISSAIVLLFLILVVVYTLRPTMGGNLQKSRYYHRLGQLSHEQGSEDKSQRYYEISEHYREKGRGK